MARRSVTIACLPGGPRAARSAALTFCIVLLASVGLTGAAAAAVKAPSGSMRTAGGTPLWPACAAGVNGLVDYCVMPSYGSFGGSLTDFKTSLSAPTSLPVSRCTASTHVPDYRTSWCTPPFTLHMHVSGNSGNPITFAGGISGAEASHAFFANGQTGAQTGVFASGPKAGQVETYWCPAAARPGGGYCTSSSSVPYRLTGSIGPGGVPTVATELVAGSVVTKATLAGYPNPVQGRGMAYAQITLGGKAGAPAPKPPPANYAVQLGSRIPQTELVDPSVFAPYNRSTVPGKIVYGGQTSTYASFLATSALGKLFAKLPLVGAEPTYPDCLSEAQVEKLTEARAKLAWYSYFEGPDPLGGVKLPLTWNRGTATVTPGNATVTTGTLKRVFVIDEVGVDSASAKDITRKDYTCKPEKRTVTPLVIERTSGSHFTAFVYWGFPFDAKGVQVEPAQTKQIAAIAAKQRNGGVLDAYQAYQAASEPIQEAVKVWLEALVVGKLVKLPALLSEHVAGQTSVVTGGAELFEQVAELAHKVKDVHELQGLIAGLMTKEYNGAAMVINGQFTTATFGTAHRTILRIAVKSDSFPDYTLTGTRNGQPLPWHGTAQIPAVNPYSANPSGLVNDSSKRGPYSTGAAAVAKVLADTSAFPSIQNSLYLYGNIKWGYDHGVSQSMYKPVAGEPHTIGWTFYDGKP